MGVIVDINEKLSLLRRARRLVINVQRLHLRVAQGLLQATELEVRRQMLVLCDKDAEKEDVEGAIELMPYFTELLIQRRYNLSCLELELLGSRDRAVFDD